MLRGRRLAPVAAVSVAALALVAACGSSGGSKTKTGTNNKGNPVAGGTLNMLGSGDVDYMDPDITYYSIGQLIVRLWARGLFSNPATPGTDSAGQLNSEGTAPDLATETPTTGNGGISADGLTYTIHIRSGAKWDTNPPRQVTAADEILGLKRSCNPTQPFGGLPDYEDLIVGFKSFCDGFAKVSSTSVSAIRSYINSHNFAGASVGSDPLTVVFKLTHPAAYFVQMLVINAFYPAPKEFLNYLPASAQLAQHTISDGPYKVQSYVPTKKIVLVRNAAWVGSTDPIRKAYVDRIVVNETVSQISTQQQLKIGSPSADMELDNFPPPTQVHQLKTSKDPNFTIGPTSSSNPYVIFNFKSPNNGGAMQKLAFRQALEYGINRTHLIQSLGGPDTNQPLSHVLPSDITGGTPDFDLYPYSVTKAKALLAQAGYPHGLTLKFLYRPASEGSNHSYQTVKQDLAAVGIHVQGVPSPNADFYTKYLEVPSVASRGVWDLSLAGWGADWYGNAALSFFNPLWSGPPSYPPAGSNFGFYNSAKTNSLITQAINAPTNDAAGSLWHQADMQVMQDAAFFPITNPLQANYHSPHVHNTVYVPTIQNYDPANVWIDKAFQGG